MLPSGHRCEASVNGRQSSTRLTEAPSRRDWMKMVALQTAGVILVDPLLGPGRSAAAAEVDAIAPFNRYPRMMQEYFVQRVRRIEARLHLAR